VRIRAWALGLLLVFFVATTSGFAYLWRGETRARRVAEANERAALDTTRVHLVDSVASYSRLVQQRQIDIEILDDALQVALNDRNAEARAAATLQISLDSVTLVAQTPVTDTVEIVGSDTTRVATFELQGPPIQGQQVVRVTDAITLDSRLLVTPFTFAYAVGCADSEAVVSWSVPEWVNASFGTGQVDPVVCNPLQPGLFRIDAGTGLAFGLGAAITLLLVVLSP
jgi:hypothetical protein